MINTKKYPYFVEIDTTDIFDKVFTNELGQNENCHPTGRELRESKDPSDWWIEYMDANGNFYYGR